MIAIQCLVSVVDDDDSVRESLPVLLEQLGFATRAFASAEQFLESSESVANSRCLILDVAMPGMTGPALQRELAIRGSDTPVIFITAHRDEAVRQRLLAQGAVECLFKPFSESALLDALTLALRRPEPGATRLGGPDACSD